MLKETLINATEAGARVLEHYFTSKNLQISNKEGINNLVTEADHASEKAGFRSERGGRLVWGKRDRNVPGDLIGWRFADVSTLEAGTGPKAAEIAPGGATRQSQTSL